MKHPFKSAAILLQSDPQHADDQRKVVQRSRPPTKRDMRTMQSNREHATHPLTLQSRTHSDISGHLMLLWGHNSFASSRSSLGTILECRCLTANSGNLNRQEERRRRFSIRIRGVSRLLQIIISEAAHLIWVLRCERVI